jgi:hypothetical protein
MYRFPTLLATLSLSLPMLAQVAPKDMGPQWPEHHKAKSGAEVILFQPQIESWLDFQKIYARAAIAYKPASSSKFELGAMRFEALTEVSHAKRSVRISDFSSLMVTFPALTKGRSESLAKGVCKIIPMDPVEVSLDRVLTNFERELQSTANLVKNPVPKIFHADGPALLIEFDGEPLVEPVEGAGCAFVLNTPSNVFRIASKTWYLQFDMSWLQSNRLEGPWIPVDRLPDAIRKLPKHPRWAHKNKVIPGKKIEKAPKVFVSKEPSELIMTFGNPAWTGIPGTKLQFVKNTESDLLREVGGDHVYVLISGRWYRAKDLDGSWEFATDSLPDAFEKIPADHVMGRVLVSIPGTVAARAATLESRIPRITKVRRDKAKADVFYLGEPAFKPIAGLSLEYATNTCQEVLRFEKGYYLCERGLWFQSDAAKGPWSLATEIPKAFGKIPPEHVLHRLAYVGVVGAKDDFAAAGFDMGYLGLHLDRGILVHGTGRRFQRSREYWTTVHMIWSKRDDWSEQEDHPFYRARTFGAGYYYDHIHNDFARALWARRTTSARKRTRDPLSFWPRSQAKEYRPDQRGGRKVRDASAVLPGGSSDLYAGKDGAIYRKTSKKGWERQVKGRWEPVSAPPRVAKESKARSRGHSSSGRYSDYGSSRSSPFTAGTIGGIMLIGQ